MDVYSKKSTWKIVLALLGLIILLITVFYSNDLARNLEAAEEKNTVIYKMSQDFLNNNPNYDGDVRVQSEIISNFSLPVILEGETDSLEGNNWGSDRDYNQDFLRKKVDEFLNEGKQPIISQLTGQKIYVFNSPLLTRIRYFPLVQALLVAMFIGLGYYIFSSTRKAEQNRVWAGMAKETAHQLGTPISAIMAWIEHLKEENSSPEFQHEIIGELERDVNRLELIADRFSKIGSSPELESTNIYEQLSEIKAYMMRRAPRRIEFDFPENPSPIYVEVNRHLFSWVLENIIRNALDAMDGEGKIKAEVFKLQENVEITISDTGKGISSSKWNIVFQPGYSTKQRGWGLGLSLAKRIIENYHKGKIFVKTSKINEGTTFGIRLPLAK
jgi:signal transduction histidine kinase